MKKDVYIIVIGVVVLGALFLTQKKPSLPAGTNTLSAERCFMWNTEAGDRATLRLSAPDEKSVTGSFTFAPFEKDRRSGTFTGSIENENPDTMTQTARLLWSAEGEGVTNQEELFVLLTDHDARPGFGEMKAGSDGVYRYASPESIFYGPTLSETSCDDAALQ